MIKYIFIIPVLEIDILFCGNCTEDIFFICQQNFYDKLVVLLQLVYQILMSLTKLFLVKKALKNGGIKPLYKTFFMILLTLILLIAMSSQNTIIYFSTQKLVLNLLFLCGFYLPFTTLQFWGFKTLLFIVKWKHLQVCKIGSW